MSTSGSSDATKANIEISGGTFSKSALETVLPDYIDIGKGVTRVLQEDGSFVVKEKPEGATAVEGEDNLYYENDAVQAADSAAVVNGVYYKTLAGAVEKANAGDIIKVLNDIDLNENITVDKDITLDLNDKTISLHEAQTEDGKKYGAAIFVQGGKLTIKDSGTNGTIKQTFTANSNVIVVGKDGELIVNDGTLENNWFVVYANNNGQVTVNGGTLKSTVASALSTNGSAEGSDQWSGEAVMTVTGGELISDQDVAIYVPTGTLNVSDGTITGATAIYSKCGTTNITGGTITGTGVKAGFVHSNNGCSATGDAIVIEACGYPNGNPVVNIGGGTVKSENAEAVAYYEHNSQTAEKIEVSAGEFSSSVNPEYLAEGLNYEAQNADNMFTYHKTISEAQEAAGEDGTVKQIKDKDGKPVTDQTTYVTVTIDNKNGDKETTVQVVSGGTINVDELAVPTKSRYKFRGWTVDGKAVSGEIDVTDNMTIEASWKKKKSSSSSSSSSSDEKTYTVSKADVENGKVKVDPTKAEKGDKVTITVTPDKGYEINKVKVTDADGNKIDLKDKGNGEYTFTMPASKVEVKATFSKAEETPVEPEDKTIVLTINQLAMSIFGETKINDVAPIIRNDRTMLPIRVVAEALGATVAWNDSLKQVTITKDDLTIEIFIGSPFAKVNGTPVQLDSPAFIENSRTYLPIRFVAENLGADVAWDQATQQVTITPDK